MLEDAVARTRAACQITGLVDDERNGVRCMRMQTYMRALAGQQLWKDCINQGATPTGDQGAGSETTTRMVTEASSRSATGMCAAPPAALVIPAVKACSCQEFHEFIPATVLGEMAWPTAVSKQRQIQITILINSQNIHSSCVVCPVFFAEHDIVMIVDI